MANRGLRGNSRERTQVLRCRGWCITINNPDPAMCEASFTSDGIKYSIWGKETAPTTNTIHYQAYVYFTNAKTLTAVSKLFPRAHIEQQRGTFKQAIEYCKKDGDFREFGVSPIDPKEAGITSGEECSNLINKNYFI